MPRQNIDYGIDLGTTNSSIARVDDGEITIFRHAPHGKTIMPSCVHITKRGQMFVGDRAYDNLFKSDDDRCNTFAEFKRTMGEDCIYRCEREDHQRSYSSEELSAEVLKQLKLAVKDEDFASIVITVPADFDQVQIEATKRAAKLAGFDYCELLQEPIAASLAFFHDRKNIDGTWLVFDFGGGTFDSAIVKMDDGIMEVIDHAGDNHLGGKNIDWLIVDEIILPQLKEKFSIENILNDEHRLKEFRCALKPLAELAKINLSDQNSDMIEFDEPTWRDDSGNKIDMAIRIDRSEFERLITPLIDRAVNIAKDSLQRAGIRGSDLKTVLMIGGPTYMPSLRKKVKEKISKNINVSIDPMIAVAQGAALFASTKAMPLTQQRRDFSKIQLTLAYPTTTAESEILLGIKIEKKLTNDTIPSRLWVEITRNDLAWATGRFELKEGVGTVKLHLINNSVNVFSVQLYNEMGNAFQGEPKSISIMQGIKIAQPPLPHDIGISAVVRGSYNEEEMVPILTKGTSLPAMGEKSFVAPRNLRPGNNSDVLKIIVWEGKGGTKPIRNVHMGEICISGDMLSTLLPEGSKIEITMRIDESRRTKVSAYIPYIDETVEKIMDSDYTLSEINENELTAQIKEEMERLCELQNKMAKMDTDQDDVFEPANKDLNELDDLNKKGRGDRDRKREVQKRLNEVAAKIDEFEKKIKIPKLVSELTEQLTRLENIVGSYGNEKEEKILEQLKSEVERSINSQNAKRIEDVTDKLRQLKFAILFRQPGYWVSVLNNINESFDEIKWTDRSKARSLVNRGGEILASGQYSDDIKRIVCELWDLMPTTDQEKVKSPRTDIVHY
jgi:molecular chaperone DnaK